VKFSANTLLSVSLAVLLHGAVLGLLLYSWPEDEAPPAAVIEHFYIDAALVNENPHKVKKRQVEAARQQRTDRAKARERSAANAKRASLQADAAAAKQAEILRLAEDQAAELARQAALETADAAQAEQQRRAMEQSLSRAIGAEQDARRAVTDDEKAMAYVSQIQREIIQNWSRPPSARNGMQALLKVYLVPTGEVVKVDLMTSSGNDAFDRSAVSAVQKAERFIVPPDANQFERNFREFEVLFRPEDLRL
jgi:colicin import membrane protein